MKTKEHEEFVKGLLKKANEKDSDPVPFNSTVSVDEVEKIVNKLKDKNYKR